MAYRMTVPGLFPPPDYAHAAVVGTDRRLVPGRCSSPRQ
jgi:hypothetical protein